MVVLNFKTNVKGGVGREALAVRLEPEPDATVPPPKQTTLEAVVVACGATAIC